jgi:predicted permease
MCGICCKNVCVFFIILLATFGLIFGVLGLLHISNLSLEVSIVFISISIVVLVIFLMKYFLHSH